MGLFGRTSVGLEIDSYEARFVELSGNSSFPKLVKLGKIAVPRGAVKDGIVLEPDKVAGVLSELWNKYKITTKDMTIGLSNQDVLVRFATFPNVPNDKLDNMIKFQAQDFLPMPVNTVVLDYIVIDKVQNNSIEVLLVAARKTMVNNFLKSLEIAELRPKDIDVTSLALWRMIPDKDKNGAVVVVNLGNEAGNILLMVNGVPHLARHIAVNLRSFIEKSETQKHENHDMAQLLDTMTEEELDEFSSVLADVIQTSVNYYYVQNSAQAIRKIIFCGYTGRIKGLLDNLKSSIDIPMELSNPLGDYAKISRKAHIDKVTASEYAVSISLALRGLGG